MDETSGCCKNVDCVIYDYDVVDQCYMNAVFTNPGESTSAGYC